MVTIDEIEIADEPERWAALGFDVRADACELGGVVVRLTGKREGEGVRSWSLRGLRSTALDGLPTGRSERGEHPAAPAHPNGIAAIDHVVAVSPSFERSVEAMRGAGLDLRRIREEPTPAGAPRQAFFRLGSEILELVEEPDEVVEAKGGPDRPVRFWGLALLAADIDRAVEAMSPHVGAPRAAVQPGRRIATLSRSAGIAVPLALITPVPEQVAES